MNDKNSIPGIPDGLEVIAFRKAKYEETYLDDYGHVCRWTLPAESHGHYLIVRKIEKPKQYRPFANGDEFKPHRDRWWRWKAVDRAQPPVWYEEKCHGTVSWQQSFDEKEFDDGSPFGVEVNE